MRTSVALLAPVATIAATLSVVGVAETQAVTPCVSRHEFNTISAATQAELENTWDVRGRGDRVGANDPMPLGFRDNVRPNSKVMKYRLCEYGPKSGAVYVYYDKDTNRWYFSSFWRKGQSPIVPAP